MSSILKCPACGRTDYLVSDALAGWDQDNQRWELISVFDKDKNCDASDCPSQGEPITIIEEEQG